MLQSPELQKRASVLEKAPVSILKRKGGEAHAPLGVSERVDLKQLDHRPNQTGASPSLHLRMKTGPVSKKLFSTQNNRQWTRSRNPLIINITSYCHSWEYPH
jgi:hypothetical protein